MSHNPEISADHDPNESAQGRRRADQYLADQLMSFQERDLKFRRLRFWLLLLALVLGPTLYWLTVYWLIGGGGVKGDYAALVRLEGVIGSDAAVSAAKFNPALAEAFKDDKAKGIILLVNSPGGSPVQSSLLHDRIMALKREHPGRKVIAVGEDMVTSGGYFIAVAADELYVNRSSVVGSIGVRMDGFGVDLGKLADRYGLAVERRLYTAGEHKGRLDPFAPVTADDKAKVQDLLQAMHSHFIDTVRAGRGQRLHGEDKALFSGDFWTGDQAVSLGLADGLSDLASVLSTFGVEQIKDYTPPKGFLEQLRRAAGGGVLGGLLDGWVEGETVMRVR